MGQGVKPPPRWRAAGAVLITLLGVFARRRSAPTAPKSPEMIRLEDTADRALYCEGTDWPKEITMAVVLGRPRVGFTLEQLTASQRTHDNPHGDPAVRTRDVDLGAHGRGDLLLYGRTEYLVVKGRIVAIRPARILEMR